MKKASQRHLLVDGYNIIHAWPEIKRMFDYGGDSACRYLVGQLQVIHDIEGVQVTIVFDGNGAELSVECPSGVPTFAVLYTQSGACADSVIEQLALKTQKDIELTLATQDTLLGHTVRSCGGFVIDLKALQSWIARCQERQSQKLNSYRKEKKKDWQQNNPFKDL